MGELTVLAVQQPQAMQCAASLGPRWVQLPLLLASHCDFVALSLHARLPGNIFLDVASYATNLSRLARLCSCTVVLSGSCSWLVGELLP